MFISALKQFLLDNHETEDTSTDATPSPTQNEAPPSQQPWDMQEGMAPFLGVNPGSGQPASPERGLVQNGGNTTRSETKPAEKKSWRSIFARKPRTQTTTRTRAAGPNVPPGAQGRLGRAPMSRQAPLRMQPPQFAQPRWTSPQQGNRQPSTPLRMVGGAYPNIRMQPGMRRSPQFVDGWGVPPQRHGMVPPGFIPQGGFGNLPRSRMRSYPLQQGKVYPPRPMHPAIPRPQFIREPRQPWM
jgi:hypothetical protein